MTNAIPRLDRTTSADRGLTIADFFVPIGLGERLNARARDVVLVVTGALFIYLTSLVVIHLPGNPIPITGQTFGVLLVGGALVGRLAELGWDRRIGGALGAMLVGSVVIYAIALPWLKIVTGWTWDKTIETGLLPFVVGDTFKAILAAVLFPVAWWVVGRRPDDR